MTRVSNLHIQISQAMICSLEWGLLLVKFSPAIAISSGTSPENLRETMAGANQYLQNRKREWKECVKVILLI
jgi:hypothetical protein